MTKDEAIPKFVVFMSDKVVVMADKPKPKFVVQAAGHLYGPFENAGLAADWFVATRPDFVAPWTIVPVLTPELRRS